MTLDSPLVLASVKKNFYPSALRAPLILFSCSKRKISKLARVDTVSFAVWPDDSIINC